MLRILSTSDSVFYNLLGYNRIGHNVRVYSGGVDWMDVPGFVVVTRRQATLFSCGNAEFDFVYTFLISPFNDEAYFTKACRLSVDVPPWSASSRLVASLFLLFPVNGIHTSSDEQNSIDKRGYDIDNRYGHRVGLLSRPLRLAQVLPIHIDQRCTGRTVATTINVRDGGPLQVRDNDAGERENQ